MIDINLIAMIAFFAFLIIFLIIKRKNIVIQGTVPIFYMALYRTKLGLLAMDRFAKKYQKILRVVGYIAISVGFLGMILFAVYLPIAIWQYLSTPKTPAPVQFVLPVKGTGIIYVPFLFWIISLMIIVIVHEFSHGVFARLHKVKIRSSGFAILGIVIPILPAAFVEPDEKQTRKLSTAKQLSIFAAGPFSNILLFVIFLLIWIGLGFLYAGPIQASVSNIYESNGIMIDGVIKDNGLLPAEKAGLLEGEVLIRLNGTDIKTTEDFTDYLNNTRPGDSLLFETNRTNYTITLAQFPGDQNRSYLGIQPSQHLTPKDDFREQRGYLIPIINFGLEAYFWLFGLIYWLWVLNFGIGLFNLAPLGFVDGGRMLLTILEHWFEQEKAKRIWTMISIFFVLILMVIVIAIYGPLIVNFITRLFSFS